MPFNSFGLRPELLQGIQALGYAVPTPVQARALPEALLGRDVIGSAQTGSGKTVAFTLPLLQRLLADREAEGGAKAGLRVRALVLTPTRELASQVERMISELAKFSPVKCVTVIGGASFHAQTQELKRGAEVVVATPAACSTTSAPAPSTSRTCASPSSMRPTACSTWASCPMCGAS